MGWSLYNPTSPVFLQNTVHGNKEFLHNTFLLRWPFPQYISESQPLGIKKGRKRENLMNR